VASNAYEIETAVLDADLVIGAVLVPGAKAPKLISNELVSRMKPGSVLSTSRSTRVAASRTPARPRTPTRRTGAQRLFYCVANMPGAVPHTSRTR
jgi:alanine dehydrogenase